MVPRDGIEPPTLCSSGTCSTTELPGLNICKSKEMNLEQIDLCKIEYFLLRTLSMPKTKYYNDNCKGQNSLVTLKGDIAPQDPFYFWKKGCKKKLKFFSKILSIN